jgi:hypothetical protein
LPPVLLEVPRRAVAGIPVFEIGLYDPLKRRVMKTQDASNWEIGIMVGVFREVVSNLLDDCLT